MSISAPPYGSAVGTPARQLIRFYYETISINPTGSFTVATNSGSQARVLKHVYFPGTQSGYKYDYSQPYGMIYHVTYFYKMQVSTTDADTEGTVINENEWQWAAQTTYNYPTAASGLSDAPTYTTRTDDWRGRTSGMPGTGTAPYYTFGVDKSSATATVSTITAPDGTVTKSTSIKSPGSWDDGLLKEVEIRQGGLLLSRTNIEWEHWEAGEYNQRQTEGRVTDNNNQTSKTAYQYYPADTSGGGFNNVKTVKEYGFDGTELRRTEFTYKSSAAYHNQ